MNNKRIPRFLALVCLLACPAWAAEYKPYPVAEHPAHPAWITRKVVEVDGSVSVEQIGYFAGTETPFAALFQDYLDLSGKIQHEIASPENEEVDQ